MKEKREPNGWNKRPKGKKLTPEILLRILCKMYPEEAARILYKNLTKKPEE